MCWIECCSSSFTLILDDNVWTLSSRLGLESLELVEGGDQVLLLFNRTCLSWIGSFSFALDEIIITVFYASLSNLGYIAIGFSG